MLTSLRELAPRLPEWLEGCPDLRDLDIHLRRLVESALYEACTNVLEHGFRGAPHSRIDLWWLPAAAHGPTGSGALNQRLRDGCFVMLDHAPPFDPTRPARPDLMDRGVRRRGRGLGLQMIHRIMAEVTYRGHPSEGNVTVLRFDPDRMTRPEVHHG